ncbi:hypothetical protein [Paeniglutamicibacter sp. NPDC091659]|uniref:hypothetical protein n=1 Tax=Paeniglutamicibacter sp. NPDC091659 TaxID=3364389 RepID=UPI0038064C3B
MGVTNFDSLPQNVVATRLRDAKQELMEQKGSLQMLSGENMIFYSYMSSVTFQKASDVSIPATVDIDFNSTEAETPLADMAGVVELSDDGSNWTPLPDFLDYGQPSYNVFDVHGGNLTPFTARYQVVISAVPAGKHVRLTVQLLANDKGST